MRRPSPIPPPADDAPELVDRAPAPPAAAADPLPVAARQSAEPLPVGLGDPVTSPAPGESAMAPIIPLAAGSTMQRPSALPGEAPPGPAPTGEADSVASDAAETGRPLRLRDVWAAARARRRALRAEVRRFTGRQRRRRALWLGATASVVLLVLVTLGAAYSPLFAVERIRIVGATQVNTLAVEAALAGQLGTPLPLIDDSAVKAALVAFPLVESYSLEARPPHELVVRIVERTPIGLIRTRAGYTLVDAAGVALSTSEAPAPGRPLITVEDGTASAAFDAIGRVMRSLPGPILAQVSEVTASTPDDVTLILGEANAQVLWGSAEESALKAVVLQTTMAARPPASVSVYDVSSPRAIVVR